MVRRRHGAILVCLKDLSNGGQRMEPLVVRGARQARDAWQHALRTVRVLPMTTPAGDARGITATARLRRMTRRYTAPQRLGTGTRDAPLGSLRGPW